MNKPKWKSKTYRSLAVIVVILVLNFLGVGEEQIGQTYDTITDSTGKQAESVKDIVMLAGVLGAAYGRHMVGKGKDENKN